MILYKFKLEDLSQSVNRNRIAGRAMNWILSPNRPSTKGNSLILHFTVDVKRLVEEGKEYPWPVVEMSISSGAAVLVLGAEVSGITVSQHQISRQFCSLVAFARRYHSCNSSYSM